MAGAARDSSLGEAASAALRRRLSWLTGVRLLLLVVLLGLTTGFGLRQGLNLDSYTAQVALITLASAFGLAGVYAAALRRGKHLEWLVDAQLLFDQLTWTVLAYLSGGVSSGATSLYGLTCVIGAILTRFRGASSAALAGAVCYGGLVTVLQLGLVSPPQDQPENLYVNSFEEVAYYAVVNLLVMVLVMLLAGYLAERLATAGGRIQAAEERAEEAEQMAALGRLAAGLAHEIRNPLGSIAGSIQLLKTGPELTEEDRQLCEIIAREASRLNDLVTDMMDYSRPRKPELEELDAALVVREVVRLAGQSGRAVSDVDVRYLGVDAAPVRADGAQLRQLVWNLVRNAVQASSAGDEVRVKVDTDGDDGFVISVEDEGIGIDDEARRRIFDAFFTTRSKGTGVGLAVVKRIADEHEFEISVESEEGKGARFRVRIPRASTSQPDATLVAEVG